MSLGLYVTVGIISVLGLVLLLLGLGFIIQTYQSRATLKRNKPLGELVEVNDKHIHLHSMGEGAITIILDAAVGGTVLDWSKIQEELSSYSKVIAFDRPGYGWSDPSQLETLK